MYKFYQSYKGKFIYQKDDGSFWEISGDTYRDLFTAEMDESTMNYFKSMGESDIEVHELFRMGKRLVRREILSANVEIDHK